MAPIARWIVWVLLLAIAASTLSPMAFRPVTGAPADFERWFAFAVLGVTLFVAYPKHHLIGILLATGFAAALEAAQNLVPGRHGHVHDFAVKTLSIVAGTLAVWAFERVRQRATNSRSRPEHDGEPKTPGRPCRACRRERHE